MKKPGKEAGRKCSVNCPECGKITKIPPEGVPMNYGIRDALSHHIRNVDSPLIHRTPSNIDALSHSIRNLLSPNAHNRTPPLPSITSADTTDGSSIKFLKLTGDSFTLSGFKTSDKMSEVKQKVGQYTGIPTLSVRLVYGGKCLVDDKSLEEYGIKTGSTVHVMTRFTGGNM